MSCVLPQPHPDHCRNAIEDKSGSPTGSRAALGCEYPSCRHGATLESLPEIKPQQAKSRCKKNIATLIKEICSPCENYSTMHNQCRLKRGVQICKLEFCPLEKWNRENLRKLP